MISNPMGKPVQVLREDLGGKLLVIILALVLPLSLASTPLIFDDGDVSWHLATGQWIIDHGKIPRADPFSFTAHGHPWVATAWLADLIYASAYEIAGYAGLAALVAGSLVALHAVLFVHLKHYVGPLGLAATIVGLDVVLNPFILARPHLLVWPIIAIWTIILLRAAEASRAPPLLAALIMLLWTNLHGSFPLGLAIAGLIGFDAVRKARWKTLRQWTTFGVASVIAALLNANGLPGLLQPVNISNLEMLALIEEWQPSQPSVTPQFYVVLLLGIGALLGKGVRIPLGQLALLLFALAAAFTHQRHQSFFIIIAASVVPPVLATNARAWSPSLLIWLAAVPLLVGRALVPLTPLQNAANPRNLIAAVPPDLRFQPVFNGYTFGGPLILAGVKPYIDGRSEIYGDAFVADHSLILQGDVGRFNRVVRRHGIRWTMLPVGSKRLITALDSSKHWGRIYSDRVGVIHVRRPCGRPPATPATLSGTREAPLPAAASGSGSR